MKAIKFFIYSAGGILLAAALERFLVAAGSAQALALPEPVLGIPLRVAVLLVGGLELVVALVCLLGRRTSLQLGWLGWLITNYAVYRIGLLAMHCHLQGTGIGSLTDPLRLSRGTLGLVTSLLPFYLLLGSIAAGFGLWRESRNNKAAASQKMSCPSCGGHIKFAVANLGQRIACPHCRAALTLRQPDETLKLSCFFCKEHIAFPAHALGTKMPCPHCRKDITLLEPK
jgi:hypothetical protein